MSRPCSRVAIIGTGSSGQDIAGALGDASLAVSLVDAHEATALAGTADADLIIDTMPAVACGHC